jgi:hypothetical protein
MMQRFQLVAFLGLAAACNATTGNLFTAPFAVGGAARDAGGSLGFETPLGWEVELDQAKIALGPFYFNIQPPQTATLRSGLVIYEVTSQVVVDPLDPTLHPVDGGGSGLTGQAIAVEIDLFPPDLSQTLEDQTLLEQSTAYLAGTASRTIDGGVQAIPFQGFITINQSLATDSNPLPALQRVNGASCDVSFTTAPSAVELRVDPTHWFDAADFSSLLQLPDGGMSTPTPDGGPYSWSIDTSFHAQVLNGIYSLTGVYLFDLVELGDAGIP